MEHNEGGAKMWICPACSEWTSKSSYFSRPTMGKWILSNFDNFTGAFEAVCWTTQNKHYCCSDSVDRIWREPRALASNTEGSSWDRKRSKWGGKELEEIQVSPLWQGKKPEVWSQSLSSLFCQGLGSLPSKHRRRRSGGDDWDTHVWGENFIKKKKIHSKFFF